jgi:type IV pilus assembly protein PilZ
VREKRTHVRVSIDLDLACELKSGSVIAGTGKDLSLGGMYVECKENLAFGTELTIVAHLPGTTGESRLPAVVRWSKPEGFGVQFGLLGARETHAIAQLLRR